MQVQRNISIISAPSILGLKPTGVERLSESLLSNGLHRQLKCREPVIHVPDLNDKYSNERDSITKCLNPVLISDFSTSLIKTVQQNIEDGKFPLVLGGDCSILIGIMPALRQMGEYGIVFMDAHADFYEPEKSITGETADMDLAIITGRGPDILTNIGHLKPYVKDENVIHIGQRDWEETQYYNSQDIKKTSIKCYDYARIAEIGIQRITNEVLQYISEHHLKGWWLHFDTDVLSDDINPAVEYRLPGGLQFSDAEFLIKELLARSPLAGINVTVFNPLFDTTGEISKNIVHLLVSSLSDG